MFQALASLAQPIFNNGKLVANLKVSKAEEKIAQMNYQQTILEAGKEVSDALHQYDATSKKLVQDRAQIEQLEKAVAYTSALFQSAQSTYLEILSAQQSLLSAQLTEVSDNVQRMQAVVSLYSAIGGGKCSKVMISPLAYVDSSAKIGKNVTIHPFAYIDKNVEIGDDCEIMPHASLMSGTRMGNRNRVFNGAVIAAEPQDFFYKGGDTIAVIGDDNVIRENVVINRSSTAEGRTSIGNGNFLHEGVHVSHDTQIGNRSVFGYGSKISGNCILEDYVIFGGNVLMSQGSRVGAWAMIQTGCRFRKDIPPFIVAAQEPTTYYGVNSFIMSHEGFSEKVIKHISHAYRIIFQGNSSLTDALLMIKDQVPMSKEIQHIIDFVGESKLGIVK